MASIFDQKFRQKSKDTVIHQFVFIEVPIEVVSSEVILWGESSWWPQNSLWKYHRMTDGEIRVGTQYNIKINKASAQDWTAEVTQLLPQKLIERTFIKGMFKGFEIVTMEERANGTRIDYELHFKIQGPLNLILWPFVFRKQYVETITLILNSMKNYLVQEYKKKHESGSSS